MTLFRIPEFTGEAGECVKTFIRLVDASFAGMANLYTDTEGRESAKTLLLISNTSGSARAWIDDQEDDVKESWAKLTNALRLRFPKQERKDQRQEAFRKLYELWQGGKPLQEYLKEVREIRRDLPYGYYVYLQLLSLSESVVISCIKNTLSFNILNY